MILFWYRLFIPVKPLIIISGHLFIYLTTFRIWIRCIRMTTIFLLFLYRTAIVTLIIMLVCLTTILSIYRVLCILIWHTTTIQFPWSITIITCTLYKQSRTTIISPLESVTRIRFTTTRIICFYIRILTVSLFTTVYLPLLLSVYILTIILGINIIHKITTTSKTLTAPKIIRFTISIWHRKTTLNIRFYILIIYTVWHTTLSWPITTVIYQTVFRIWTTFRLILVIWILTTTS